MWSLFFFFFFVKRKSSSWNKNLSDRSSLGFITAGSVLLAALRCLLLLELNCVDHNALSARRRRLCPSLSENTVHRRLLATTTRFARPSFLSCEFRLARLEKLCTTARRKDLGEGNSSARRWIESTTSKASLSPMMEGSVISEARRWSRLRSEISILFHDSLIFVWWRYIFFNFRNWFDITMATGLLLIYCEFFLDNFASWKFKLCREWNWEKLMVW